MSGRNSKKKGIKIFFIVFGTLVLIFFVSIALFFIPWIKGRIISYVEDNSEYTLKINSIVCTGLNSLEITGIELLPKLDVKQFYKVDNTERDWISLKTHLVVEEINWKALLWDKKLNAGKVCFTKADLYVYRDKKMPDAVYKYKPLPSRLLRNAPISITLPLIQLMKGRIEYEENPENGSSGKIVFGKLYGTLHHISNDSTYLLSHPEVILDGKGMIMDSIEASMQYRFSTLNKNDHYSFSGYAGSFSASLLNKVIIPISDAGIRSGEVKRIAIHFEADDNMATGTLAINYNHLKIDLLTKKHHRKNIFVNAFIRNNVKKGDKAGEINCHRNTGKFIFNYWWVAIKSGLVSSIVKVPLPTKKNKKRK